MKIMTLAGMAIVAALVVPNLLNRSKAPSGEGTHAYSSERSSPERAAYAEDEWEGGMAVSRRDARGQFSFDAIINGSDVQVLVDTGASSVAINRSVAEQIGLELSSEQGNVPVNTANGRTYGWSVTIDEIVIDEVLVRNVKALVLEDEALSVTLLGMSFLGKLERFEITGDTLTLTQ